ncbi:hypothetical protein [Sphingobium yanoikuyae]|jgi:predicted  nucleic acid-binding Zn-ribbon protein|uniref:hypothetical protein n=1 Tax=Sphingobium yanoikuyae TaxID=13690 RepID=UPI0035C7C6C2
MKATPRKAKGRVTPEKSPAKPRPRPSRKALELAEQKMDDHRRSLKARIAEIEEERARIGTQIAKVRKEGEGQTDKFQAAVDKARAKYEDALEQGRGQG